jgi:hypothetical protein
LIAVRLFHRDNSSEVASSGLVCLFAGKTAIAIFGLQGFHVIPELCIELAIKPAAAE